MKKGKRIFELLKEQAGLIMKLRNVYIPGWWLLPTTTHRRMKEIDTDMWASLMLEQRSSSLNQGR
ncbi:hypothetical protein glysoja_039966 [Glycine soja]|uniref:Uncharacterized protein n=1 Tax=Glycine soja TaxID=3848 RepID=A0A0B2SGU4_GLYSO|nr:hypothetical protein glysoja_039966 [Glycine soja]